MHHYILTFAKFCIIIITIQNDFGGVDVFGAWFIIPLFCFGLWWIEKTFKQKI